MESTVLHTALACATQRSSVKTLAIPKMSVPRRASRNTKLVIRRPADAVAQKKSPHKQRQKQNRSTEQIAV
jgi:hypothetical protein